MGAPAQIPQRISTKSDKHRVLYFNTFQTFFCKMYVCIFISSRSGTISVPDKAPECSKFHAAVGAKFSAAVVTLQRRCKRKFQHRCSQTSAALYAPGSLSWWRLDQHHVSAKLARVIPPGSAPRRCQDHPHGGARINTMLAPRSPAWWRQCSTR